VSLDTAGKAMVMFIIFSLFSCGDMETLFPGNDSYQIRALINGNSLENCSIVRSNDKIRPYFAVSVVDDPDLISLLVYLQNPQGEVTGERVFYTLQPYASVPVTTETEKNKEETIEETNGRTVWELPEHGAVHERWSFTNAKYEKQHSDIEIAVYTLADELPYFSLPKKLEIGSYTLVFEALGQKDTLSRTETNIFYLGSVEFNLKDISMYLPGLSSGSQLITPGTTVMLEANMDFDNRLDPYVVWYNGKNVISRGKISDGAWRILWKAPEQASFYSLRLEVFPFQLKNDFAGISREIMLPVSPKAISLGYFFEKDLKYAGYVNRIPLAEGTAYPQQVRLITAMLSSEKSDANAEEGKSASVMPSAPELLQWYQFEGNLRNELSLTDKQSLIPSGEKDPHWIAAGQSYGLAVGSDDEYHLPQVDFFPAEQNQGGGIFLLHIRPPAQGIILSAFFPLRSSSTDGVSMDLIKGRDSFMLRLKTVDSVVEIPVYPAFVESPDLIPIVVEFYIQSYRLEAKISLGEDYSLHNKTGKINLPGTLSGEGIITLGSSLNKSNPSVQNMTVFPPDNTLSKITDDSDREEIPVTTETLVSSKNNFTESVIWDELAILRSTVPLLQEEGQNNIGNSVNGTPHNAARDALIEL
jgi:hypothetical protein